MGQSNATETNPCDATQIPARFRSLQAGKVRFLQGAAAWAVKLEGNTIHHPSLFSVHSNTDATLCDAHRWGNKTIKPFQYQRQDAVWYLQVFSNMSSLLIVVCLSNPSPPAGRERSGTHKPQACFCTHATVVLINLSLAVCVQHRTTTSRLKKHLREKDHWSDTQFAN